MHTDKNLSFDEFSRVGIDDWKQKAIQDLKGKSLNDLHYVSSDGIKVDSYCCYENSNRAFKIKSSDWKLVAFIDDKSKKNEEGVDLLISDLDVLGDDMGVLD